MQNRYFTGADALQQAHQPPPPGEQQPQQPQQPQQQQQQPVNASSAGPHNSSTTNATAVTATPVVTASNGVARVDATYQAMAGEQGCQAGFWLQWACEHVAFGTVPHSPEVITASLAKQRVACSITSVCYTVLSWNRLQFFCVNNGYWIVASCAASVPSHRNTVEFDPCWLCNRPSPPAAAAAAVL